MAEIINDPIIPDPYPTDDYQDISDFKYKTRLVLGRDPEGLKDEAGKRLDNYVLLEPYEIEYKLDGKLQELTVPKGMITDLVSVPWFGRRVVSKVGPHLEAAIVHDYLFVAWQIIKGKNAEKRDFKFANELMFAGLKAANVKLYQRLAIQAALNAPVISWGIYKGKNEMRFAKLDLDSFAMSSGELDADGNPIAV